MLRHHLARAVHDIVRDRSLLLAPPIVPAFGVVELTKGKADGILNLDQHAKAIAGLQKFRRRRVVRSSDEIDMRRLEGTHIHLRPPGRVGPACQGMRLVMVDAAQQDRAPVQTQPAIPHRNLSDTDGPAIDGTVDFYSQCIEVRVFGMPEARRADLKIRGARRGHAPVSHKCPIRVGQLQTRAHSCSCVHLDVKACGLRAHIEKSRDPQRRQMRLRHGIEGHGAQYPGQRVVRIARHEPDLIGDRPVAQLQRQAMRLTGAQKLRKVDVKSGEPAQMPAHLLPVQKHLAGGIHSTEAKAHCVARPAFRHLNPRLEPGIQRRVKRQPLKHDFAGDAQGEAFRQGRLRKPVAQWLRVAPRSSQIERQPVHRHRWQDRARCHRKRTPSASNKKACLAGIPMRISCPE